jgi:hypothetical protein
MNTLRYLILWLAVALAAITNADTLQQKVDALGAAPNVLEAWIETAPVSFGRAGTLYAGKVAWVEVSGQTVQQRGIEVIVKHLGEVGQEAAYWVGSLPAPLQVTPDAYITGRTGTVQNPLTPFTSAQVQAFCNAQWKATSGNAAARDVMEFSVENVTPNTVRVSGLFHDVATNNRVRLTYLISLVDANGATTGANVKFEKVVE